MLKKLRGKKTAKRIWVVLTILILPAFLFWGFGSFIRSKQELNYVGKISGKRIPLLEFKDSLDAAKNQAIIQFGDNISEIQKSLNLESLAWNRLVLLAQAKKRKINVSDEEVISLIESYPFFQKKGKFDNQVYSQMLQYVFRTQPRVFEEQVRQSLMLSKLYDQVTGNINVSEEEARGEYQKLNEQISLYYIAGLAADFTKGVPTDDKQIRKYFEDNSFEFKEPPYFNVEFISIPSEGNKDESVRGKIKRLLARIARKEDFAKAAKEEFGLDIKVTGLFGQADPIPGIGWSPQISSLLAKLKEGDFAPPVFMDKNYYLLRLKEKREPYIPDYDAIKEKIKEDFIKEKAREIARQKMEECLKELAAAYDANPKSLDFDKIARGFGLKSDSTGLFGFGSYIEGIGASDTFFTRAQGLKDNAFSGIIEMPSGFYIIRLKTKVPVDEKKFLEEKAGFAKRLLLQKKEEYFSEFLKDLKTKTLATLTGLS